MLQKATKGYNQFWRYLLNIISVFLLIQVATTFIIAFFFLLKADDVTNLNSQIQEMLNNFSIIENLIFLLSPMAFAFFIFIGVTKIIHNKTFTDITTAAKQFRITNFVKGFVVWLGICGLFWLCFYQLYPDTLNFQYKGADFWLLIIISFVLLPFQTGFEEIIFRGYLYQGFGLLFKSRWLSVFATSILFALMHIMNPEVSAYGFWAAMSQYFLFGLMFGIIALFDNGIEMSWGAHAANNIFLAIFVTHESSVLQTPALFVQTEIIKSFDIASLIIGGTLMLLILWKWQKWSINLK